MNIKFAMAWLCLGVIAENVLELLLNLQIVPRGKNLVPRPPGLSIASSRDYQ